MVGGVLFWVLEVVVDDVEVVEVEVMGVGGWETEFKEAVRMEADRLDEGEARVDVEDAVVSVVVKEVTGEDVVMVVAVLGVAVLGVELVAVAAVLLLLLLLLVRLLIKPLSSSRTTSL